MNTRVLAERYELGQVLGAGGMAEVYEGWDRILARRVAVKVLSGRYADDPSFLERFRREARAAASLNHPNIVGVFDTGTDNGVSFIVMELVEGRSLRDRLAEGPLTPAQVTAVGIGVCSALAVAHGSGLVHRDIKPGNVMLLPSGQVKVMDFGIARAIASEPLTNTANVVGTAQYLSPEQAQGFDVDGRTDIYALGCCLYEMLTGRVPFNGESPVAIAYQHVREAPVPPRQIDPEVPPALEAITMRALAKRPEDRFPSAEEMRLAFEQARQGHAVAPPPPSAMQPAPGATVAAGAAGFGLGAAAAMGSPAMAGGMGMSGPPTTAMAGGGMGGPGQPAMGMAGGGTGAIGMGGPGRPGTPTSVFGGAGGGGVGGAAAPGPATGPIGSRAARSARVAEEDSAVRSRLPVIMAVVTVVLLIGTAIAAIAMLRTEAPPENNPVAGGVPETLEPEEEPILEEETSTTEKDEETTTTAEEEEPTTTTPSTAPPATQPPATRPPATRPPATRPPATRPPATTRPPPPENVRVPNVEGRTAVAAEARLEDDGFRVSIQEVPVNEPGQVGIVQDQNPSSGTLAPRGSTVTITVGAEEESPDQ